MSSILDDGAMKTIAQTIVKHIADAIGSKGSQPNTPDTTPTPDSIRNGQSVTGVFMDSMLKQFNEFKEKVSDTVLSPDLNVNLLKEKFDNFAKGQEDSFRTLISAVFAESSLDDVLTFAARVDPESKESLKKDVRNLAAASVEIFAPLISQFDLQITQAISSGISKMATAVGKMRGLIIPLEATWKQMNSSASALVSGFDSASYASPGKDTLTEGISGAQEVIRSTVMATGQSRKDVEEYAAAFQKAGVDILKFDDSIRGFSVSLKDNVDRLGESNNELGKAATGLNAAILLSKGTGLEIGAIAQDYAFFTKELGVNAADAGSKIGLYSAAIKGSKLSIEESRKAIREGANSLKFFGDTTDAVANTYRKFVRVLKEEGKEGLADDLSKKLTDGVANLDMAKKAFLAMTGGSSGKSAITGALEIEEALGSGDQNKIDRVMNRVTEEIEKMTGSSLLTMREALDTGKGDTYHKQREMLKSFGLAGSSDKEAGVMLDTLAKSKSLPVEMMDGKQEASRMVTRGREHINSTTSSLEALQNMLQMTADISGVKGITENLSSSTENLLKHSDSLDRFSLAIQMLVTKPGALGSRDKNVAGQSALTIDEVAKAAADPTAPKVSAHDLAAEREKSAKGASDLAKESEGILTADGINTTAMAARQAGTAPTAAALSSGQAAIAPTAAHHAGVYQGQSTAELAGVLTTSLSDALTPNFKTLVDALGVQLTAVSNRPINIHLDEKAIASVVRDEMKRAAS